MTPARVTAALEALIEGLSDLLDAGDTESIRSHVAVLYQHIAKVDAAFTEVTTIIAERDKLAEQFARIDTFCSRSPLCTKVVQS